LKNRLGSLAVFIAGTIVALLIGEAVVRLTLKVKFSSLEPYDTFFDNSFKDQAAVYDEDLGYAPGPQWTGPEGRFGYQNGAEYEGDKNPKTEVAILGDSLVLHHLLMDALYSNVGRQNVRIFNAGIGGYNTVQESIYLRTRISHLPNVLILSFCLNDFAPSMTVSFSQATKRYTLLQNHFEPLGYVNPFWFKHSALYRLFSLARISLLKKDQMFTPAMIQKNIPQVKTALEDILNFSRKNKMKLVVAVYPHITHYEPGDWMDTSHREIVKILNGLKIQYVDGQDLIPVTPEMKFDPEDVVHPSLKAHTIMAEALVREFPEYFGLPPRANVK
jgi:lysophospholipase L1-like esterase